MKRLILKDPNAVKEALKESGMDLVEQIDTTMEASMFKAARVKSRTARRVLRCHLRHHFGMKVFASEGKLMKLNQGYTDAYIDIIYYDKNDGKKAEKMEYAMKDMAGEVEHQTACIMESNIILPGYLRRIDLTTGGDHGQGALQQDVQVTIILDDDIEIDDHDEDDKHLLTYELIIIIAEVICKKDNAEIMKLIINTQLSEAMKEIAKYKLALSIGSTGAV